MAHHRERHPTFVDDCLPCKLLTVSVSSQDPEIKFFRQREKDLHRYREKRRAGEHPDGTTKKAMEASERKQDVWDRQGGQIADTAPPEQVAAVRKSLLNE